MPSWAIPDLPKYINRFTDYLKDEQFLGLFNFREFTRVGGELDRLPTRFLGWATPHR